MYLLAGFQSVHACPVLAVGDVSVVLSHIPLHASALEFGVVGNIHGHRHDRPLLPGAYLDVSVEQPHMQYRPISLDKAGEMAAWRGRGGSEETGDASGAH